MSTFESLDTQLCIPALPRRDGSRIPVPPILVKSGTLTHTGLRNQVLFRGDARREEFLPPPKKDAWNKRWATGLLCCPRHPFVTQTVGVCRTDGDGDRCVAPMPSVTHLGHWPTTMPPLCRRRRAIKARRRRRRLRSHTPPAVSRIQTRPPTTSGHHATPRFHPHPLRFGGGSVAEWLACCSWTQAQKVRVQIAQSRRCRVTVLGKLFTPIVPLFTKQQNW